MLLQLQMHNNLQKKLQLIYLRLRKKQFDHSIKKYEQKKMFINDYQTMK